MSLPVAIPAVPRTPVPQVKLTDIDKLFPVDPDAPKTYTIH